MNNSSKPKSDKQLVREAIEGSKEHRGQGPNGVPWRVVNEFMGQLNQLNSCLAELAQLTASGDEPPTPALLANLSQQYEKLKEKFIEEAKRTALPLTEGGAA